MERAHWHGELEGGDRGPGKSGLAQSGGHRGSGKWYLGCILKVGTTVSSAGCAMWVTGKEKSSEQSWGFWSSNWEASGTIFCNGDVGEGADLQEQKMCLAQNVLS